MPEILVSSLKDKNRQSHRGGESRLFFGMLIAQELNVGFVPVRKPNKLPYTISASYELEYNVHHATAHYHDACTVMAS
jgi:adenine phosphoribosyltransferase